jgi:glycosyltransferase involved in cell wall biosynthesis
VGATNATSTTSTRAAAKPVSLFLMVNTFETGGSERQFTVLAQNLSANDFQLHLGCVSHRGEFADQFKEVPQFPLGGSLFGWKSVRTRFNLSRHLRTNHVDVAHAFDFYANLTLIPAARLARVPVVIGSHRQLGDLMTAAQFRAQAAAFRWCDAVVCNSHAAAARLAAAGIRREKLAVIGNALPSAAFEPAAPALPRHEGLLRIGMVARMNAHYKNHAGFLRIAAEVSKRVPEVEFVLVGDGPLRPELEKQAKELGLTVWGGHSCPPEAAAQVWGGHSCPPSRVLFLGDRQDIPAVLASLDVAVLTSDSESLSNVILEAMAASLPVVAYNVGGNAELLNEQWSDGRPRPSSRGALISPGQENAFAEAIIRLLSDVNLRRQQGKNARQFVEENFSLDRVRRRYEELYAGLLDKKSGRRSQ